MLSKRRGSKRFAYVFVRIKEDISSFGIILLNLCVKYLYLPLIFHIFAIRSSKFRHCAADLRIVSTELCANTHFPLLPYFPVLLLNNLQRSRTTKNDVVCQDDLFSALAPRRGGKFAPCSRSGSSSDRCCDDEPQPQL